MTVTRCIDTLAASMSAPPEPPPPPHPAPDSAAHWRERARLAQAQGRLADAIAAQVRAANLAQVEHLPPTEQAADCHRVATLLFTARDAQGAVAALRRARTLDPHRPDLALNLGMALMAAGRTGDALVELQAAERERPDPPPMLLDAPAHAWGRAGRLDRARSCGERSLLAKDAAAGPSPAVSMAAPLPRFDPANARRHVISFSLFGRQARYLDGALANTHAAVHHYPGWTCRFHVDDSVPAETCAALVANGAQLRRMPRPLRPADGLFWRFTVTDDPEVTHFLLRDADSVLNAREAAAVQAWLASGRGFHVMRDHPAHTDLILAGLWGGMRGRLPPLAELLKGFRYHTGTQSRSADQVFLAERVWPRIRHDCLLHDSVYRVLGAQDFPAGSALPPGRHVGDNASAFPSSPTSNR
jgi:hypothetical protein